MPTDTPQDRKSAAGGVPPTGPGVTPDATPGSEWRQQAAGTYSGITPGGGGGGNAIPLIYHHLGMQGIS